MMLRTLGRSVIAVVVLTVAFGLIYPIAFTGFAQVAFADKANGSLIERDGAVVGSKLAAQAFTKPQYFHPRPSATAPEYNAGATNFANLGPTNPDLAKAVRRGTVPRSNLPSLGTGRPPMTVTPGHGSGESSVRCRPATAAVAVTILNVEPGG